MEHPDRRLFNGQTEALVLELNVPSIGSGHCVRAITEAVRQVDPQAKVQVDITKKSVQV